MRADLLGVVSGVLFLMGALLAPQLAAGFGFEGPQQVAAELE